MHACRTFDNDTASSHTFANPLDPGDISFNDDRCLLYRTSSLALNIEEL